MSKHYLDPSLQARHDQIYKEIVVKPNILPPKIDARHFEVILSQLRDAIGSANVVSGADVSNYCDPYPLGDDFHQPSAAVSPSNVAEIQKILKIANEHRLPIWTTARGKNLGYGGPAPRAHGSVVMSLHRMNKVLEANQKLAYVVVEPGVTFIDLFNYLEEHRIDLWPSAAAIGWGSVMGNTLEKGFGYNAKGEHISNILSMEVLLPNGELIRTGQWAVSNSSAAHVCRNSFGPQVEGLFLQTNLGIVTKIALSVQPAPKTHIGVRFHAFQTSDIAGIVKALRELFEMDVMQNHVLCMNLHEYAATLGPKHKFQREPGPMKKENVEKLMKAYGCGYWVSMIDFYGPKSMVDLRYSIFEETIKRHVFGVKIEKTYHEREDGMPLKAKDIGTPGAGMPHMAPLDGVNYMLPPDGTGVPGHSDSSLILPTDGDAVFKWFETARPLMESCGVDPFIGCHVFEKYIIFVQQFVYDVMNKEHIANGARLNPALTAAAKKAGYAHYRSHLQFMDDVQELYDFNGHAYKRFVQSLKAHIDPNGILSPGKQGIWPTHSAVLRANLS